MKTVLKIITITIVLILTIIVDIPILPVELVPDADAVMGVRRRTRRRTAVVVHSADESAAAQQQAAAPQQQAAPPQQQASGVPVGTVASALPAGCTTVTVGGTQYQDCSGSFYKTAFQGNNLVYVVVQKPLQ
jgi:hypothetical protein